METAGLGVGFLVLDQGFGEVVGLVLCLVEERVFTCFFGHGISIIVCYIWENMWVC